MGLLSLFARPSAQLQPLPRGSFTVDADGRVLASTLPNSVAPTLIRDVTDEILAAFRAAQSSKMPLTEVVVRYSSLKLTARELRGGAIIFLTPVTLSNKPS
jgi:hypothetical protein